jgi:hypothetical protein
MEEDNENIVIDEKMFKEMVLKWIKLDDKITTINEGLKELKTEKKQYENHIISFMDQQNEDTIKLSSGKLKKNVLTTKGAIKEDIIQEAIEEFTKDSEKATQLTKFIIEKRELTERVSLKRLNERKKKEKK